MYVLRFKNPAEVRMGSPYNVADVELQGEFVPSFEGGTFQDKGILNELKDICYLIEWKTLAGNRPGFCVWKISEKDKTVEKTQLIEGCCDMIELSSSGIELLVFRGPKKEKLHLEFSSQ